MTNTTPKLSYAKGDSTLARLLATENIRVQHHKAAKTAMFDLKNRVLILPMWAHTDRTIYEMIVAHEVGHALFTPPEDWISFTEGNPTLQSLLNVVEDARIEKLIIRKYPGCGPDFVHSYGVLHENNVLGTQDTPWDEMGFIDRINCHFKLRHHAIVPFSKDERVFVDRIATAETFEDVVAITRDIAIHVEENEKEKTGSGAGDIDGLKVRGDDASTEADPNGIDIDKLDAATQRKLRQYLESVESEDIEYRCFPAKESVQKFLVPWTEVLKSFRADIDISQAHLSHRVQHWRSFYKRENELITYMVHQFTLRQNARKFEKVRVFNTGKLNPDRLWSYKLRDDVFLQRMVVPKGKNHGFLMLLDLSGSMQENILPTIQQSLSMALFCQRLGIPFELYGFTSSTSLRFAANTNEDSDAAYDKIRGTTPFRIGDNAFRLVQFLSHDMPNDKFNIMAGYLLSAAKVMAGTQDAHKVSVKTISLGSTPLNEAMLTLRHYADEFRKNTNVDILNTIVLTDGDADSITSQNGLDHHRVVIEDCKTSHSYMGDSSNVYVNIQQGIYEVYKRATGSNLIGYHIVSGGIEEITSRLNRNESVAKDEEVKKYVEKNKFYPNTPKAGLDVEYIITPEILSENMAETEGAMDVTEQEMSRQLFRDGGVDHLEIFKTVSIRKNQSKIFIRRFVESFADKI